MRGAGSTTLGQLRRQQVGACAAPRCVGAATPARRLSHLQPAPPALVPASPAASSSSHPPRSTPPPPQCCRRRCRCRCRCRCPGCPRTRGSACGACPRAPTPAVRQHTARRRCLQVWWRTMVRVNIRWCKRRRQGARGEEAQAAHRKAVRGRRWCNSRWEDWWLCTGRTINQASSAQRAGSAACSGWRRQAGGPGPSHRSPPAGTRCHRFS